MTPPTAAQVHTIAVLGNPNAGKTSLFNRLTGLRQKTGNYPGVTVEKKTGFLKLMRNEAEVIDLPGTYSLLPRSLDEAIVHDVLLDVQEGTPAPECVVLAVDASNLERNLYLALQVIELGLPTVIALNMWDLVEQSEFKIDVVKLQALLGVPCVPTVARRGVGMDQLKAMIEAQLEKPVVPLLKGAALPEIPEAVSRELDAIAELITTVIPDRSLAARAEALRLLGDTTESSPFFQSDIEKSLRRVVAGARESLDRQGVRWLGLETQARYAAIERICNEVQQKPSVLKTTLSDKLDYVFTHKFWGLLSFIAVMAIVFQSIFSWAVVPMDWISSGVESLGRLCGSVLPEGALKSLVVDGIVAGVGNVLVFLPQIFLLFFFIALFEDFGYMARAAFVLDRVMKRVGLNGKAFLPLLSSFACAIPGIMATRTIQDKNDRLATILVAPLMSCSARLPVYALMIAAFIPAVPVFGIFDLKGLTLLGLYTLSIVTGLGVAALFRSTFLKGSKTPFVFELPPYRVPNLSSVLLTVWDRGKEFLIRAGTIIFCISIILWFLVSYPRDPALHAGYQDQKIEVQQQYEGERLQQRLQQLKNEESGAALRHSFAGRAGNLIEPVIQPLGFDWKLGVGLIGSFAAREVLVSTLAIVYNVGEGADENSVDLITTLQSEVDPDTGKPLYTPLVAVSLMVFFVLACQCMSTIAVVRRETNSWRWPLFMLAYMTTLAWIGSFLVYQGGRLMGFAG